jgi:hypothetical protein
MSLALRAARRFCPLDGLVKPTQPLLVNSER